MALNCCESIYDISGQILKASVHIASVLVASVPKVSVPKLRVPLAIFLEPKLSNAIVLLPNVPVTSVFCLFPSPFSF